MEGAGIMLAAASAKYDAEAMIIKAVADWGDGRKNEVYSLKSHGSRNPLLLKIRKDQLCNINDQPKTGQTSMETHNYVSN